MPHAVVVSHDWIAHELGHIEPWLDSHDFTVTRIYREDPEPIPSADLLIVMGSPGSVAGTCPPATLAEVSAVRDWVDQGRPYLGICFGAQLLATAMGGSVSRMSAPFSGYVTLDGVDDDVLHGPWLVWHNDGITAPADATVLGALEHADLAFRTRHAWGLQPHIEVTADTLERMLIALDVTEGDYAPVVDQLKADSTNECRAAKLLEAFWADVS